MEARQLEHFVVVAEERNFTRAAARLHLVQSAVSASIKALEASVGVPLFFRSPRSVELTPEGCALLGPARAVVRALDEAADVAASFTGTVRGRIALGVLATPDLLGIGAALARFRREYPEVSVTARTSPTGGAGLVQALLDETLDLSFLALPMEVPPAVEVEAMLTGRYAFAVGAGHPLDGAGPLPVGVLDEYPLVAMPSGFAVRAVLDRFLLDAGLDPEVEFEVSDLHLGAQYAAAGLGIAMLTEHQVDEDPALRRIEVEGWDAGWVMGLAWKRDRRMSAATTLLLDILRASAAAAAERDHRTEAAEGRG